MPTTLIPCCDFHSKPRDIQEHLSQMKEVYGKLLTGEDVDVPRGYMLIPFGLVVPPVHRTFHKVFGWSDLTRDTSTMTPVFAKPNGNIRAYAYPHIVEC